MGLLLPGGDLAPWIPVVVAFAVSTVTSMGGVSGAFLLMPFQVSVLGLAGPSATATNHLYNVVAAPGGVFRYWRDRRVLWPLVVVIVGGAVPGVWLGAWLRVRHLSDPGRFKLFLGAVLLFLGVRLLLLAENSVRAGKRAAERLLHPRHAAARSYRWWSPPTSGNSTTSPISGPWTPRGSGASPARDKWQRVSL